VRNGISGILTIQDGSYQHRFPLTSSELLSDTVSYAPETEAVEFRLEVYRDRYRHTDDRIVVFADTSQSPAAHAALGGIPDRVAVDVDVAKQNQRNKVNRPRAGPFRPAERPAASVSRLTPPPALTYEAVVPVRKAIPAVPRNLRALISERISVAVKVVVDAAGEVISAKPVNASGSGTKLLNDCAVQAAMLWRFEPARRDGQPVGSEAVVTFNFEPQTH
jgi:TonB family protein